MTIIEHAAIQWLSHYGEQGVFTTDNDLMITSWNHWLINQTSISQEKAINQRFFSLFPELEKRLSSYYQNARNGQITFLSQSFHKYLIPIETGIDKPGFELMRQRVQIAPIIQNDIILGTMTIIQDVTDQSLRETELQEQINSLQELKKIGESILTLNLQECLGKVIETTLLHTEAEVCAILLRYHNILQLKAFSENCINTAMDWDLESTNNIAALVWQTQNSVYLPRQSQLTHLQKLNPQAKSMFAIPLKEKNIITGIIVIESFEENDLDWMAREKIEQLGVQASIAIQNANLYEESKQNEHRLKILLDINNYTLNAENASAIALTALTHLQSIIPYIYATAFSFQWETDSDFPRLVVLASHSYPNQPHILLAGTSRPMTEIFGDLEKLKESTTPFIANIDELRTKWPQLLELTIHQAKSLLYMPLIAKDEFIGLLLLWREIENDSSQIIYEVTRLLTPNLALVVQLANLREKLYIQATHDPLTSLFNRRHFFEKAEAELKRCERYPDMELSVLIFDIDHFKKINDTFGHLNGDRSLKRLAKLCQYFVRETDIPARYGGEEFVILLPETDIKQAMQLAERLRIKVSETEMFFYETKSIFITISIGVAQLTNLMTIEQLINKADKGLYAAKAEGRNVVRPG